MKSFLLALVFCVMFAASSAFAGNDEAGDDEATGDEAAGDETETGEAEPEPAPEPEPEPEPAPVYEHVHEHTAAEPRVVAAPPPKPVVGYKGGFFVSDPDGKFVIKFNGLMQAKLHVEGAFDALDQPGVAFSVPQARLKVSAKLFGRVKAAFQIDFGKGNVAIKDAYLSIAIDKQWLHVTAGQFKKPFSRQSLTSSSKLQIPVSALAEKHFAGDSRDVGLMIHNDFKKVDGFGYGFGVLNGSGSKGRLGGDVEVDPATGDGEITSGSVSNVPDVFGPMLTGRVGWSFGGVNGYDEVDPGGSGALGFSIGAGALVDLDLDDDDDGRTAAIVDWLFRVRSFSFLGAAYVGTEQDGAGFGDQAFDAFGVNLQAGYAIGGVVEPGVRWSRLFIPGDNNDEQQFAGIVNVYLHRHQLKWGTLVVVDIADDPLGAERTLSVVSQIQAAF